MSNKHNQKARHRNTKNGPLNLVGPKVAQLRKKQKPVMTQEDLAGKLAVQGVLIDRSGIAKIETQRRTVIDIELVAIAKALKTVPDNLLP
ncbi:MAG: helix-turn-helix transcriptional regulator [Verrucomicrobiota bacterium]